MIRVRSAVRSASLVALALLLPSALGCQSILGIEDTRVEAPGFTFEILTVNASLPLNSTAGIEVAIARTGGFDGEVEVKPGIAPSGLSAPAITIAAGETSGVLSAGAVAPLDIGNEIAFELEATAVGTDLPVRKAAITRAEVTGKAGAFDTSYGPSATGLATVRFGNDDSGMIRGITLTGDRKLLVIGYGFALAGTCTMARLGPAGALDPTFATGDNGILRFSFNSGSSAESPRCMAVGQQTDGRLLVIADHQGNSSFPPDVGLIRMSSVGVIGDLSFNNGGRARIDLKGEEETTDGVVLRDGRPLAVGVSSGKAFVMRATVDGNLDPTFASPAGFFKAPGATPTRAEGVFVDDLDRILVTGWVGSGTQRDLLLFRLTADGQRDSTFGDNGVITIGDPTADERGRAVAVRSDGKIVVAGHSNQRGTDDFQIYQFLDDGKPDSSFGDNGVVTTSITAMDDRVADVHVLPDDKIVVIGNTGAFSNEESGNTSPVVVRYTKTGALDKFFSGDGIETSISVGTGANLRTILRFDNHRVIFAGGNEGGVPGPGTFGIVVRMWM